MTKRDLPPVHPGEILLEDFLKPMESTRIMPDWWLCISQLNKETKETYYLSE